MKISKIDGTARATALLRRKKGLFRTGEVLRLGIHPRVLYSLRDAGALEQVARGLYGLANAAPLANPDLSVIAARVPKGVICLVSALAFHEMTTQVPHEVHLALARGARSPRLTYPPVRVFWFTGDAFTEGIESHIIDGMPVRIYCPEKTLADAFKYRAKTGLDVAIEAMKLYRQAKKVDIKALLHFARICRVEEVMRPYLESIL
jgi:predicted transcriptional regulator of viral defense system